MKLLLWFISVASIASSASEIDGLLGTAQPPPDGDLYAVLVAGSDGWWNYRHQADVAHAYHTLRNHGVSEKNIIVLMKDDIAGNEENPYPGKLFNRPHGEDVYKGLKIDYRGDDVTPENFLNILKGEAKAVQGGNRRVVNSTTNDRIFVYFTDHGGVGIVAFPDDVLTVKKLNDALKWMHKHNRFRQLVFYMEACESGSMFKDALPKNIDVYAITASNEEESSWGTYCDNDMNLPCLGDLFSVNWMEDSDKENLNVETLDAQFEIVKKLTNESHVQHYGNLSIAKEPVSWFQGTEEPEPQPNDTIAEVERKKVSWPSRDVELIHLHQMRKMNGISNEVDRRISKIYRDRQNIETVFAALVTQLVQNPAERRQVFQQRSSVNNLDCHDEVVRAFDRICIDVNKFDYALKYMNVLNNLCTKFDDPAQIIQAMQATCTEYQAHFI